MLKDQIHYLTQTSEAQKVPMSLQFTVIAFIIAIKCREKERDCWIFSFQTVFDYS